MPILYAVLHVLYRLRVRVQSAAGEVPQPSSVELEPFVASYDVTHLDSYRNYSIDLLLFSASSSPAPSSSSSSSSAGRRQLIARASLACRTLSAAPLCDLRSSLRARVRPDGVSALVAWQPPAAGAACWNGPPDGYRLNLVQISSTPPASAPQRQQQQRQRLSPAAANATASHRVRQPPAYSLLIIAALSASQRG